MRSIFNSYTLLAMCLTLLPASAFADILGGFACVSGHAQGTLYDTGGGVCPATMKFSNVFSFLICHTEQLSANLMGQMYCGVMQALLPAVAAMVTLAVVFFGISFTIGFTHISAKDFQAMLLKVALVIAFATQADYIIGIGYNLLVTGLRDGTAIAVSSLYQAAGTPVDGLGVYEMLDKFLAGALHMITDNVGAKWDGQSNPCKNAIFAVMAIMAIVLPPVFYLCIILLFRICLTFCRAIFCYMYALIGITFLLTLAPFFLSFYLFKITQPYFTKWVSYLISCSLQIVITFAFLAFMVSIKVDNLAHSFTDIIMPTAETKETNAIRFPWNYCTVCQFKVVDNTTGADLTNDSDFLSKGKLQCKDNPPKALSLLEMHSPSPQAAGTASNAAGNSISTQDENTLIKFATHGLIALVVLAYIVDVLLASIPQLARTLSVGFDTGIGMPGGRIMNVIQRSFGESFGSSINSVSAAVDGFKKSAERLVVGERGADGGAPSGGIMGGMVDFIRNPLERTRDDES